MEKLSEYCVHVESLKKSTIKSLAVMPVVKRPKMIDNFMSVYLVKNQIAENTGTSKILNPGYT